MWAHGEPGGGRRGSGNALPAAIGGLGSCLLALGTDLPGSRYGAELGAKWPFAADGAAPHWEGPVVPGWTSPANNLLGPGRLLPLLTVGFGIALLVFAWALLLKHARVGRIRKGRSLLAPMVSWVVPLLFAAPFASQDVWMYGAEGKAVLVGLSSSAPVARLGHSIWLAGVDPRWAQNPSMYGPGALDLAAVFVRLSGGSPWVAVEYWRLATILGLSVVGWVARDWLPGDAAHASRRVLWSTANPGVLVIVVAGVHNDGVMMGLIAAGLALAAAKKWLSAIGCCVIAVTFKAPAALALLAVVWQHPRHDLRGRLQQLLLAVAGATLALIATGVLAHGGFSWLHAAAPSEVSSAFALVGLSGSTSGHVAGLVQLVGLGVACTVVLHHHASTSSARGLALGFAILALTAATAQPWYLCWPLVLLGLRDFRRPDDSVISLALVVMMTCSELPLGDRLWSLGVCSLPIAAVALRRAPAADQQTPRDDPALPIAYEGYGS